jgi:Sec-independent protein secretion pathway component TatC
MLLETVPLYLLFEAGVLLAAIAERRRRVIRGRPQPEGTV